MKVKIHIYAIAWLVGIMVVSGIGFLYAADESVTLTTYYPAPYGEYTVLKAKSVGIGTADSYFKNSVPQKNLVVEGSVGIGTASPDRKLHIVQSQSGNGIVVDMPGTTLVRTRLSSQGSGEASGAIRDYYGPSFTRCHERFGKDEGYQRR